MRPVALLFVVLSSSLAAAAPAHHATLTVDARDAPRRMLHAQLSMPATPGPLTLRYPKWIPGEHGPNGPVVDVAGIVVRANGKIVPWHRDDVDLYALRVELPAGASSIDLSFDYLAPA
ncbi:MAG: M61 family peptidase, partial [Myxococcales bacterium]|nr:M61 family peptidase [Myxococcales bacterium]